MQAWCAYQITVLKKINGKYELPILTIMKGKVNTYKMKCVMKIAETLSSKAIDRIVDRSEKIIVQGNPEGAIPALRQVLETYPNNEKVSKTLDLAFKKIRQKNLAKNVRGKSNL